MNRASPAALRRALEAAQTMIASGVDFVPIPVLNEDDRAALLKQLDARLTLMERAASEVKH